MRQITVTPFVLYGPPTGQGLPRPRSGRYPCTAPGGRPGRGRVFGVHRPRGKWCTSPEVAPARAPVLSPPRRTTRRTIAPPRPVMVRQNAVVLRFGYFFILWGRGPFPLEKGARILRGIRLNAIYGVFEIGGRGGDGKAMRGREMSERGVNWEGNRKFRGK